MATESTLARVICILSSMYFPSYILMSIFDILAKLAIEIIASPEFILKLSEIIGI